MSMYGSVGGELEELDEGVKWIMHRRMEAREKCLTWRGRYGGGKGMVTDQARNRNEMQDKEGKLLPPKSDLSSGV
jgi:hypothetical protein